MDSIHLKKTQAKRMDIKRGFSLCCSKQETELNLKDRHYLRIKGWEKIFQSNGSKKQVSVAILISKKIEFKLKPFKKDGEGNLYSKQEEFIKIKSQS